MTAQDKAITPVKHGNIAAALAAAQGEMGRALKSANNPHFRIKYADLASVMDACMPALTAHGIAVIQPTGEDEAGRYVETILIHADSDGTLKCRVPLIVQKNDMQGYGSAVTYARRYGLMAMAGIAPEDDNGNAAAKAAPAREESPNPKAIEAAKASLSGATNLGALRSIFTGLPPAIRSLPAVIEAKDNRKNELEQAPPPPADDLDGDHIPH